jgi:hypothetical protein
MQIRLDDTVSKMQASETGSSTRILSGPTRTLPTKSVHESQILVSARDYFTTRAKCSQWAIPSLISSRSRWCSAPPMADIPIC